MSGRMLRASGAAGQAGLLCWSLKTHFNTVLFHPDQTSAVTAGGEESWRLQGWKARMNPHPSWPCFILHQEPEKLWDPGGLKRSEEASGWRQQGS